jgi:hypothetical protein
VPGAPSTLTCDYAVEADVVRIVRILHGGMNAERHLLERVIGIPFLEFLLEFPGIQMWLWAGCGEGMEAAALIELRALSPRRA